MRVDAAGAVPGGASAGAAGDGFVVAEAFDYGGGGGLVTAEAEGEVIAVALGGGAGGKAAEDDVCDALGLVKKGLLVWGWGDMRGRDERSGRER